MTVTVVGGSMWPVDNLPLLPGRQRPTWFHTPDRLPSRVLDAADGNRLGWLPADRSKPDDFQMCDIGVML
jgi:hypothetical protein